MGFNFKPHLLKKYVLSVKKNKNEKSHTRTKRDKKMCKKWGVKKEKKEAASRVGACVTDAHSFGRLIA
jgi:hypothetical protein